MGKIILAVILCAAALAQQTTTTTIKLRQIVTAPSATGMVPVTLPDGKPAFAALDPAGSIRIDTTTDPPIIRSGRTPPAELIEVFQFATPATLPTTLARRPRGHPAIYLNGLMQSETIDYTWNQSQLITFKSPPVVGDVLHIRYCYDEVPVAR